MTEQEIDQMEAGREMDCLVAERVLGWHRIQAPQFDYDGPLPEQGEVLVSPRMLPQIESGEYKWPPKGVIPLGFFVTARYSADIAAAWQVVQKMMDEGWLVGISNDQDYVGELAPAWHVCIAASWGIAKSAPLAICRAALKSSLTDYLG